MRKDTLFRSVVLFVAAFAGCAAGFTSVASAEECNHEPITQELKMLIRNNPEIGELLQESIDKAAEANPDPVTNPVRTIEDYYNYVDRVSKALPQDILLNYKELPVHEQMIQGLCHIAFLVDQPLPELEDKGLFKNTIQYYEPFASWLRHFAVVWGQYLDTDASWNDRIYREIKADPTFHLDDGTYESPSNWHTFNQFFSRYLSSPDQRPIASPDDPTVVVSPADSVPQGVWPINDDSEIEVDGGLTIKTATYYSVHDLLRSDSAYRDVFAGGVLTHNFLNVNDYHRYHFAVGGTVKEKGIIIQNTTVEISWDGKQGEYVPTCSTGWQFTHTHGYVVVDTGEYGLVALIPMGMSQVSSVNFEDSVKVGAEIKKGDMLGNFLFGGSDFVLLFQEEAGFKITAPMKNETEYEHILMGEEYGRMGSTE
ncbi:MAG: phosphatidylserine decarboxylase [Candidatus Coatesbacteria bacterium]|nr:MAG: phosphatidylserine decarboxylase [Candidatus Coatesbacteria bacterium]